MKNIYAALANELDLPAQAVHLVHFVLKNMKASCVFPPDPRSGSEEFYTPVNICSAVMAYLVSKHADDPWGTLAEFGIQNSSEVGRIVFSLQSNPDTCVVPELTVDRDAYGELFNPETRSGPPRPVRWCPLSEENAFPKCESTADLLKKHFCGISLDRLVIIRRRFPRHIRADVQRALDTVLTSKEGVQLFGLTSRGFQDIDFTALTEEGANTATKTGPLTYSEIDVGEEKTVNCLGNGLWLALNSGQPYAVVLGDGTSRYACGSKQLEIAVPNTNAQLQFARSFLEDVQSQVESSSCYRGKILSFEGGRNYRGYDAGIKVHELKKVRRDEVILPQKTLDLLDRNVVEFVNQRRELAKRGMNLKKGLLLFGPPGTGKTHTVHYLSQVLPDTTTLIITAEQMGLLSEYMTLARLLQPSLVIIEDADLIAGQRERTKTCEEVLLNRLLNEMDGLQQDAEIIFLLTTNRPQALEAALTARPGRIDQAIEYPLPDADGRAQLARLYAGFQELPDDVVAEVVSRTDKTSAAFIKELMRRSTQYAITRGPEEPISASDVITAVEEMVFSGGAFNRQLLGGSTACEC